MLRRLWELRLAPVLLACLCATAAAWSDTPMDQGIAAYNAGHYDQAVGLLGEAEPTNFNNPVLHYYLGNALAHTNHRADAIKQYKLALILDPSEQLAKYCQTAIKNLDPSAGGPTGKPAAAGKPALPGQTPQVLAVLCGCPLCLHMDGVLSELQNQYGDKVLVNRILRNPVAGADKLKVPFETASEVHKNDAVIKLYKADGMCPTLLFFGSDGQLANQMSGVIADIDLGRQMAAITGNAGATDKRNDDMRATIMRDAQARLVDAQRMKEQELQAVQHHADVLRADVVSSRFSYSARHQIETDMQSDMERINAEFVKRQQQILDDANARANSLGSSAPIVNVTSAPKH